jgi:hypothetical protein
MIFASVSLAPQRAYRPFRLGLAVLSQETARGYRRSGFDKKVEDYRKHAEECRILAGRSRVPAERDMLFNMARTWDNLAKARADQIAQHQRVKDIAPGPGGDDRMNGAIPIEKLNASNESLGTFPSKDAAMPAFEEAIAKRDPLRAAIEPVDADPTTENSASYQWSPGRAR